MLTRLTYFKKKLIFSIRYHNTYTKIGKKSNKNANIYGRILWMDFNMTDIIVDSYHILNITCLVTNGNLDILATSPSRYVLEQSELNFSFGKKNKQIVRDYKSNASLREAETKIIKFLSVNIPKAKCPLAGNNVYLDKIYIEKYMPSLNLYLSGTMIDLSSIRELARKWYPNEFNSLPADILDRAYSNDIVAYIEELKYYKGKIFKSHVASGSLRNKN